METDENELREQLCQAAGHLWQRGLVSGTRATVSVELHRRRYLVTPAGRRQAGLSPDDLVTIDLHGADLRGTDKGPSHLSIVYEPNHHGDDAFRSAIVNGARQHHWNFGDMAAIPGLDDTQIDAVIDFIRSEQERQGFEG